MAEQDAEEAADKAAVEQSAKEAAQKAAAVKPRQLKALRRDSKQQLAASLIVPATELELTAAMQAAAAAQAQSAVHAELAAARLDEVEVLKDCLLVR